MKTVIRTEHFLNTAKACGMSEEQQLAIVDSIAANPDMGIMISGTGGCRKCRFAGRGKGKSGGYRTIHYNGSDDVPVVMLIAISKGARENIGKGERNELKVLMQTYEQDYRAGVLANVAKRQGGAA